MIPIRFPFAGCLAACGLLSLAFTARAVANPNHHQPHAAMAVHGDEAKQLQTKTHALYEECRTMSEQILTQAADGKIANIHPGLFGNLYPKLHQADRHGRRLRSLGEPAGADYVLRIRRLLSEVGNVVEVWRTLPASQRYMEGIRAKLVKQAPARAKELARIQTLAQQQKWPTAEEALDRAIAAILGDIVYLDPAEGGAIIQPFNEVHSLIEPTMRNLRQQQAAEVLAQRRQQLLPDLAALLAEVSQPDSSRSGPQQIDQIVARWHQAHAAMLRVQALDWARKAITSNYGTSGETSLTADATTTTLAAEYERFSGQMVTALAARIEADAARVPSDEVEQRYGEYLAALAPLVRVLADSRTEATLRGAVEKLAAQSPVLPARIASYRQATDELLRWRARTARSQAQAQQPNYRPLEQIFFQATSSREDYVGFFPLRHPNPAWATLLTGAPDALIPAAPRIMNQRATASAGLRLAGESKAAIGQYHLRTYANSPAPLAILPQVEALRADLLVTDELPPLTLAAFVAVQSAERGDWETLGGEIAGMHLEGVITRFATLPVAASPLIPLGQLVREKELTPLDQVLMRFDIRPEWVQHPYFFARLEERALASR